MDGTWSWRMEWNASQDQSVAQRCQDHRRNGSHGQRVPVPHFPANVPHRHGEIQTLVRWLHLQRQVHHYRGSLRGHPQHYVVGLANISLPANHCPIECFNSLTDITCWELWPASTTWKRPAAASRSAWLRKSTSIPITGPRDWGMTSPSSRYALLGSSRLHHEPLTWNRCFIVRIGSNPQRACDSHQRSHDQPVGQFACRRLWMGQGESNYRPHVCVFDTISSDAFVSGLWTQLILMIAVIAVLCRGHIHDRQESHYPSVFQSVLLSAERNLEQSNQDYAMRGNVFPHLQ